MDSKENHTAQQIIESHSCSRRLSRRSCLGITDLNPVRGAILVALLIPLILSYRKIVSLLVLEEDYSYAICSPPGSKVIYTVDKKESTVECFLVKDSRIDAIGSYDKVRQRWNSDKKPAIFDFLWKSVMQEDKVPVHIIKSGNIVVPGLADAHAHVLEYGFMRQLDLVGSSSVSDVIDRLRAYLLSHPDVLEDPTRWIEGMGWDQTRWPGGAFPIAADFDREPLLKDRLIALRRVDGHAMWVSDAAINLIKDLPENIEGGKIVRDEDGNPTGIFVDNAMTLLHVPAWSEKQMVEYFDITIREGLKNGLTSIHDAATKLPQVEFFKRMADKDKLPLRLYLMGNDDVDFSWLSNKSQLHNYGPSGHLNFRSIKLFADGALGSWGAAMLQPYTDKSETSGTLLSSPERLSDLVKNAIGEDFQVNIHCIGDKANNVVLNMFEGLLSAEEIRKRRPRIEHAQIMTLADLERTAKLGVIPSVQPTHATSDMWYAEDRIGPQRMEGAYAYRTLLETSETRILPLGSDFPVEGINPLLGFYAAVTRLSVDGDSPHGAEGWYSKQKLSRYEALKGMTYDAAYASFMENDVGSITEGKFADFVVLDTDIMMVQDVGEILETRVVATVVDGKVVYGDLNL